MALRILPLTLLCFLWTTRATVHAQQDNDPLTTGKLGSLMYHIDRMYVDDVDKNKLVDAAIVSMLAELDPHSIYIPKEDLEEVNEPLKGNFEGVGIQFNIIRDTIYVVDAIPGGPSERIGIRAGDRIVKIDMENVAGVSFKNTDVMKRLRGKKGTKVDVSILRKGEHGPLDFTITRDRIPIFSVEAAYMAEPTVGYIKVSRFSATTMKEFREKLTELKAAGMKDLVLDLQGNGGGYLRTAIEMADEFLGDRKLVVYTEGRTSPREDTYATKDGLFEKGRLVVLVDEGSASASEIVSGAIQDWDRGLIVGRRSFGKGAFRTLDQRGTDLGGQHPPGRYGPLLHHEQKGGVRRWGHHPGPLRTDRYQLELGVFRTARAPRYPEHFRPGHGGPAPERVACHLPPCGRFLAAIPSERCPGQGTTGPGRQGGSGLRCGRVGTFQGTDRDPAQGLDRPRPVGHFGLLAGDKRQQPRGPQLPTGLGSLVQRHVPTVGHGQILSCRAPGFNRAPGDER